jgi:hypothetical protein
MMSGNGLLDPETVKIMDEAFGVAWRFLRSDPVVDEVDRAVLRKALARALLASVRTGERNAHRRADGAIAVVRQAAIASMVRSP